MKKYVIDAGSLWGLMISESTYLTIEEMKNGATYNNSNWRPRMFDTRADAEKWVREHRRLIPGNHPYIREWNT